jgi:hypothetical protein
MRSRRIVAPRHYVPALAGALYLTQCTCRRNSLQSLRLQSRGGRMAALAAGLP